MSDTLPLLFFSYPVLFGEFEQLLGYRKLAKAFAATGLTPSQLPQRYQRIMTVMEPAPVPRTVMDDPDDDHVIACAVALKADFIVSGDSLLLALKKHECVHSPTQPFTNGRGRRTRSASRLRGRVVREQKWLYWSCTRRRWYQKGNFGLDRRTFNLPIDCCADFRGQQILGNVIAPGRHDVGRCLLRNRPELVNR